MKVNPNRFWTIVILLGWAFDFLFWKKSLGLNFAIYVILCLLTGVLLLRMDGLRLSRRSSLLLLPIAFLATMTFIRQEPMTAFLSVSTTLFLMGVFAITYLSGRWIQYGLLDYFFGYLRLFGSMIARPLGFATEMRREQPNMSQKRKSRIWPVVRGVVIALPVIAIFATLLSSADPIFAERLDKFIKLFNIDNLPEYIFRFVYILVFGYALAGTFLHAAQSTDEKISVDKPFYSPFLGFTEAAIVLGSVAVLFAVFVVIQFQYFFGGQANITITGYTFSEYARKGFGELVTVAFFSLLLLLGLGSITRRETDSQRRMFSILGAGLVGLVIVILISAFYRLVLYEIAYGFSRLRTYTHVFMIWLALLLIVVVVLEVLRRERSIGLAMVLAFLGFVISLTLLNVDAFIVRRNIQREINGSSGQIVVQGPDELDAQYFLDLSDDAVPELVSAFLNKSLPSGIHEKVGAALACKRYSRDQNRSEFQWQSFHISRFNADLAFDEINKGLDFYKVIDKDWPVKVKSPIGKEFSCYQYYSE